MSRSKLFSFFNESIENEQPDSPILKTKVNPDITNDSITDYEKENVSIPAFIEDTTMDKIDDIKKSLESVRLASYKSIKKILNKIKKHKLTIEEFSISETQEKLSNISEQQLISNYKTVNTEHAISCFIKQEAVFRNLSEWVDSLANRVKDKYIYNIDNGIKEETVPIVNDDSLITAFSFLGTNMYSKELEEYFNYMKFLGTASYSVINLYVGDTQQAASSVMSSPSVKLLNKNKEILSIANMLYGVKEAKVRYSLEKFLCGNNFVVIKNYLNNTLYPVAYCDETDRVVKYKLYFITTNELKRTVDEVLIFYRDSILKQLSAVKMFINKPISTEVTMIEHINMSYQFLSLTYANILNFYILIKYIEQNLEVLSR